MSIISRAPYYDKYNHDKKYTQLLAVPGRVAQAREFTEIQSTLKDIIRALGDSIMSDGNIVEGCQVIPDKSTNKVTVTPGKVYMGGMVLDLEEVTVDMKGVGTEIVGVKLKESIIYEYDDPDLLDPALGFDNYRQPGCDRLKSELEVVCLTESEADTSVAILTTLIEGEIAVEQQAPNYSQLNETLARRTYDESGSYIVEGLNTRVEDNLENPSLFNIVIEPGKAYVHGYELTVPSSRRLTVPRAITSIPVTARYVQTAGQKYLLTTGYYVKSINSVLSSLQSTESVTINNSQGAQLRFSSAYNIIKIEKSGGGVIPPSNYRLEQGPTSYIRWNDSTFPGEVVVTYYYTYEFEEGVNYELYKENDNHYLRWLENTPNNPINGESLIIEYEKYLARKDTVYMDQYGNIDVIQGTPADYGLEIAPTAPTYTLPLSSILSPPGGEVNSIDGINISVSNVGLTRFTMQDIHKMLKRIRTIEYDQTILSLDTEAKEHRTLDKRGIFTDPFIDLSKIDFYFNLTSDRTIIDTNKPIFDTTLDLQSNMIHLPLISNFRDAKYDANNSTVHKYDRVVTLKKSGERVVLAQKKATKSYLVSPYLSAPMTPEVFLSPSLDTGFDIEYIDVPKSITREVITKESTRHVSTTIGSGNMSSTEEVFQGFTYTAIGTNVEHTTDTEIISESINTYIRSREVEVSGNNYPPSLDNIKCYFEGVYVPLTPIGGTVAGTDPGSIKADVNGSFKAKFTIPSKIPSGARVVTLASNLSIEGYKNSAFAFYMSDRGTRRIQRTYTTITTVLQERVTNIENVTTRWYYDPDPLAQTFILDKMTLLSGIDIYFENVPGNNVPVTCEIREVNNGNITSKIYGFKTLMSNDIRGNVSADSSKATRFQFNDPVLLESNREYAFVLKSSSTDYRVFVAEIGETDILSNEAVLTNPYLLGVMMSSSNNSSWNNHQKSDIKFQLIADTYEKDSIIEFDNIHDTTGFCRMNLTAESIILKGTDVKWMYQLGDGIYHDITPYNIKVLDNLGENVKLRAILSRTDEVDISPVVALDSVSLLTDCYDNESDGYYISNIISGLDEYDKVEIILDTYEPAGTSLQVFVSPSSNNATPYIMKKANVVGTPKEMNYRWFETTYEVTLDSPATICRIFVKLDSQYKYITPAFRRLRAIMS